MKSTAILTICCAALLMALGWVSTISVERIDSLKAQLAHASQNFTDCSAALVSAKSTAADLREQGKTSQENCASAIRAAQSINVLALPPISTEQGAADVGLSAVPPVNSPPREVNDAAFTTFLNTF